ncbi:MAG: hypothetical protein RIG62_03150 [Cyclobacteriaceae bacterium]
MRILHLITIVLYLAVAQLQAQVIPAAVDSINPDPIPAIQLPDEIELAAGQHNRTFLQQIGEDHQATLWQSGQQQELRIFQEGEAQQLQLFQLGNDNQWQVTQQGIGHEYTGVLRGDENQIQVLQSGAYNSLQQDLLGNGMDYQITQQGSNLELIQIENNGLAPAYQVQQTGEGMRIIIENGMQSLPE